MEEIKIEHNYLFGGNQNRTWLFVWRKSKSYSVSVYILEKHVHFDFLQQIFMVILISSIKLSCSILMFNFDVRFWFLSKKHMYGHIMLCYTLPIGTFDMLMTIQKEKRCIVNPIEKPLKNHWVWDIWNLQFHIG